MVACFQFPYRQSRYLPIYRVSLSVYEPFISREQGRRHEVWIGGRGRIHRHPSPPTRKILFLLGFRPLYFENVGKCLNNTFGEKNTEIS